MLSLLPEAEWMGFGTPVRMPSYRRPLGVMISALAERGFMVELIVEPRPIEGLKTRDPETYELLGKRPSFLCIRTRKEMSKNQPSPGGEQGPT